MQTIKKNFHGEVERFIDVCKEVIGGNLRSIILFGSIARGEYTEWSDMDFCIVVKKRDKGGEFNLKLKIRELFGKHTDIIFREEEEMLYLLKINSSVDLDIFNDGICVHGEDVILKHNHMFNEVVAVNHLIHRSDLGKGVWEYGY